MTLRIREWYRARSRREQRLLLAMVAVAIPVFLWFALVRPLANADSQALDRHLEAVDRHGRMLALAESIEAEPSRERLAQGTELQLVVSEAATLAGVTLADINPSGEDSVSIGVESTRAPAAAEWLRSLDARGLAVDEFRMTAASEGGVHVSARVARR